MANEVADGFTVAQVPKTHGLVPRGSQGVLSVLRKGNVLNEVVVALQGTLGNSVAFTITGQVPDDGGLIC